MAIRVKPRQTVAIAALLAGKSHKEAAAAAQVSEMTLYRWHRDKTFKKAYSDGVRQIFGESVDRLQIVARKAVDGLEKALCGSDAVRVRAALGLLTPSVLLSYAT
jgi:hypothetical protein